MVVGTSLVILILAIAFFAWRQHSERRQNAVLRAEVVKLRGRLRAVRP